MSGVRIKNLESAGEVIEQFDEFEFVVDSPDPDSTLKLSGKELKKVVAAVKHTHLIQEVERLPEELDKKLNKAGGTITGNLHVQGDAHFKNLRVDEYLEVPELKYNRITATGNEFWVTDAGVVDEVSADAEGVYTVRLKEKEGEVAINFAYKDILRGIFYTQGENGNPTGFRTAYFEVTGIASPTTFTCTSLNGIAPARFMTLARQGNKTNVARQGSIYMDGLYKYIRVLDGVKDGSIDLKNIKVQLGDLSEINHPIFGQLRGCGALLENAYVCGRLIQKNPTTGEEWAVGAVSVQGEQVIRYNADGTPENASVTLTATEHGITSTSTDRKWQYKSGANWIDIPSANGLSYTLAHNAAIWNGRNTLTLRYVALDLYDDTITITKIGDGRPGTDGTPGAPVQKGDKGEAGKDASSARNLLLNSNVEQYGNGSKYKIAWYNQSINIEQGEVYTLALSYSNSGNGQIGFWISGWLGPIVFPYSANRITHSITFTAQMSGTTSLYHFPNGSQGTSTVYWAILVKGEVAPSMWIAAPEDINAAIAEAAKAVTFRGEFSPYTPYYNTTNRKDCVRYGGNYYIYRGPNATSSWWNDSYWESFGAQFDSVATGLLLAELAYIENLGVKNLRTNTSGQRVEITQNNNALAFYDGMQSYPVVEASVTDSELPTDYDAKRAMLTANGIALWDVAHHADRIGSLDSAIRNEEPNDIKTFIAHHLRLKTIAFNGKKAE